MSTTPSSAPPIAITLELPISATRYRAISAPARNFLSQYKNLVHRYYHRREAGDAETFWAGCGAVRKESFLAVGGFDAAHYPYPSIEDIELGWRLRQCGLSIVLLPELQGTHLKVWRLVNLVHTDVFRRALPWSRLIHAHAALADTLNIGAGERINAGLALAALLSLAGATARAVPSGWTARSRIAAPRLRRMMRSPCWMRRVPSVRPRASTPVASCSTIRLV